MRTKPIILSIILAACSVMARAQEPAQKSPEERSQQRTERMTQELALTPDQVVQVSAINGQYALKSDQLKNQRDADRKARRKEQELLREAYDTELKTVLTPEQFATFQAKRDEASKQQSEKPHMRLRMGGR